MHIGGFGAEIAAKVEERCFLSLEAPTVRVTGFDTHWPYAWDEFAVPTPPSNESSLLLHPSILKQKENFDRASAYFSISAQLHGLRHLLITGSRYRASRELSQGSGKVRAFDHTPDQIVR